MDSELHAGLILIEIKIRRTSEINEFHLLKIDRSIDQYYYCSFYIWKSTFLRIWSSVCREACYFVLLYRITSPQAPTTGPYQGGGLRQHYEELISDESFDVIIQVIILPWIMNHIFACVQIVNKTHNLNSLHFNWWGRDFHFGSLSWQGSCSKAGKNT